MDDKDLRKLLKSEAMTLYAESVFSAKVGRDTRSRLLMKEARIVLKGFRDQMDHGEIVKLIVEIREENLAMYNLPWFSYKRDGPPFYFSRLGLIGEDEAKAWYTEQMRPYYEEKRAKRHYDEFRRAKSQVLKRDKRKCVCCPSGDNLVAHHIAPWKESQSHAVDNLVALCPRCHLIVHGRGRTLRGLELSESGRKAIEQTMERYKAVIRKLGHSWNE